MSRSSAARCALSGSSFASKLSVRENEQETRRLGELVRRQKTVSRPPDDGRHLVLELLSASNPAAERFDHRRMTESVGRFAASSDH